jgi:hypothetical protein
LSRKPSGKQPENNGEKGVAVRMIFAIDPGPVESAYCIVNSCDYRPIEFGKYPNDTILARLRERDCMEQYFAIEMVASYGMAVGKDVFETVCWIGRYWEAARERFNDDNMARIYRMDVKMNLCQNSRAKDTNIRQALIDRFGDVGTKKNPGWFYGFKGDIWSAYAVAVTYFDTLKREKQP